MSSVGHDPGLVGHYHRNTHSDPCGRLSVHPARCPAGFAGRRVQWRREFEATCASRRARCCESGIPLGYETTPRHPRRQRLWASSGVADYCLRRRVAARPAKPRPRRARVPGSGTRFGGGAAQTFNGEELFRGEGVPAAKSAALLLVSVHPPFARNAAVVLDREGAAPAPSKKSAIPYPTRSRIRASCSAEQCVEPPLQPRLAVPSTRATLPDPAAICIGVPSTMSGVGSGTPEPAPAAC